MNRSDYRGCCAVCGSEGLFMHDPAVKSIRENFTCRACKASLRYREQARLIVKHFSRRGATCLAELADQLEFRASRIYEPGLIGPFRNHLRKLKGYRNSFFGTDVSPGETRDGVECQDLMKLTFEDDAFDLVISSDIFEHVRKPFVGFREVNRVLKPGGFHIFSIPVEHPMPRRTVFRVDTSEPEDVHVLPALYHGLPGGNRILVYTDFGADMVARLADDGIDLKVESAPREESPSFVAARMLSFYWRKPRRPLRGVLGSRFGVDRT